MMMLEYDSIGLCRRTRGRVEQTGQSCWKWFFFCHITECPLLPTKRRSWRHNLKTASVCLWWTWVCVLRSQGELFIIRITQTAKLLRWQGHLDFFETVSVSAWPLGLFIHAVCRFAFEETDIFDQYLWAAVLLDTGRKYAFVLFWGEQVHNVKALKIHEMDFDYRTGGDGKPEAWPTFTIYFNNNLSLTYNVGLMRESMHLFLEALPDLSFCVLCSFRHAPWKLVLFFFFLEGSDWCGN